jgi:hypothetical protein
VPGGPEITFVVSYRCPHCQSALEGRTSRPAEWVRCPKCGRASEPPASGLTPEPSPFAAPGEDVLVIGPDPHPTPMTPVATGALAASGEPGSALRVAFATGLFVTVTMLIFSFLDRSESGIAVFGASSFVFLLLLARPARTT